MTVDPDRPKIGDPVRLTDMIWGEIVSIVDDRIAVIKEDGTERFHNIDIADLEYTKDA